MRKRHNSVRLCKREFRFQGLFTSVLSVVLVMLWCFVPRVSEAAEMGATRWRARMLTGGKWKKMNGAIVSTPATGLRVEIAEGRRWAIAYMEDVLLPPAARRIDVNVARGRDSARWVIKLTGDFDGLGRRNDWAPFFIIAGDKSFAGIEPRVASSLARPLEQLQLGLEGAAGDYVVFKSLEFSPGWSAGSKAVLATRPKARDDGQINVRCVELMPSMPEPFKMRDWRRTAIEYDKFVFDFGAKGKFLPLIWIDDSRMNIDRPAFGLPSYVGDVRQRRGGAGHEGVNCTAAVLSATLMGIDKRKQKHDYVAMCEAYFNRANGTNLVLNLTNTKTGGSFWYEIWPHVLFYALVDRYPGMERMEDIMRITADKWREACVRMSGRQGKADFNHTAFDFEKMEPVDNGRWREPDAAAGIAWLELAAWKRFGDLKYLSAADTCMKFLDDCEYNPYYEILLPFGVLVAARMNAELGRRYDVDKMLNWCFGLSDCRGGWGVVLGNWGGYDCYGLVGSFNNRGGYAFAMNTFAQAGALVPMVRYDPRYARAIGKWILNLANAARLFYPNELPEDHQSCSWWMGDPKGVIAYEGLRYEWEGKQPYATGDPVVMKWGPKTNRGLYGSSHVGFLASLVAPTTYDHILRLDCLATDFFRDDAYPTFLYYNPYSDSKKVRVELGDEAVDLYDLVAHELIARGKKGEAEVTIDADGSAVVVIVPSDKEAVERGSKLTVGGVVVDYGVGRK